MTTAGSGDARPTALVLFGTRPEAIKLAPVVEALRSHPRGFDVRVGVTGQHREMLDQVLRAFDIRPDFDLAIMQQGQTLCDIAARSLLGLTTEIDRIDPSVVIVQGDTTTTLAAALASFYGRRMVAYVESGLRSGDVSQPFPEEMNRILATRLASVHYPPTETARQRLLEEGVDDRKVLVTGNTVIDALLQIASKTVDLDLPFLAGVPSSSRIILVTMHRRENWGEPIERVCRAILRITEDRPDVTVAFALHENPVVRETARRVLGDRERILLLPALDYVPFVALMRRATLILTDSGGVQEEAPSLGKPILVLRERTERPEGIAAGAAKLVGTGTDLIVTESLRLLDDPRAYEAMSRAANPYGDGNASQRIADHLAALL